MIEEQPKVEPARGDRPPIDGEMSLLEVEAARSDHERGRSVPDPVRPPVRGLELDRSVYGVEQVGLALQCPDPRGRMRILEVRHVDLGPRVEGVDDHLSIHRPGDLDPAVSEVRRGWRYPPIRFADALGVAPEARRSPFRIASRNEPRWSEELSATGIEPTREVLEERESSRREDPLGELRGRCSDAKAPEAGSRPLWSVGRSPTRTVRRAGACRRPLPPGSPHFWGMRTRVIANGTDVSVRGEKCVPGSRPGPGRVAPEGSIR